MEFTLDRRRRHTVISCSGRLDRTTAAALKPVVTQALGHAPLVVVDLHGTAGIDATGLSAIVAGLRSARLAGGDLRVVDGRSLVLGSLIRTGLQRLLPVFASVNDALLAGRKQDDGGVPAAA